MSYDNGNATSPFTPADYRKGQLARKANKAALGRLESRHREEYEVLINEERGKLGLPPRQKKMTLSEMRRLADLAIEHGLA